MNIISFNKEAVISIIKEKFNIPDNFEILINNEVDTMKIEKRKLMYQKVILDNLIGTEDRKLIPAKTA